MYMPDGNTIRSVAKAMELLQILSDSGALTLSELRFSEKHRVRAADDDARV